MKINTLLIKFSLLLAACALAFAGCSSDDGIDNRDHGYGHLQFKLYKAGTTRAADQLEYLRDANKIQVFFRFDNKNFNQTLLLSASDEESAEYGMRSETVKLSSGNYQIIGYTVFDKLERELANVIPEEQINVQITDGHLTLQDLEVNAVLRGKIRISIVKDLSDPGLPQSRAAEDEPSYREYTFDEIKYATIVFQDAANARHTETFTNIKGKFQYDHGEGTSKILCDTLLSIPAGRYRLKSVMLTDTNKKTIDYLHDFPSEAPYTYQIEDVSVNHLTEVDVPVKINSTAAYIKDYVALRAIWEATGGNDLENPWYYVGENYPEGANWNFDKDVDLWGDQPGVTLHSNGRVAGLSIGSFNPHGKIPAEIGQLTEMTQLYLGTHGDFFSEEGSPEFDEAGNPLQIYTGTYAGRKFKRGHGGSELDRWANELRGYYNTTHRWEIARRELEIRHRDKNASQLFTDRKVPGYSKEIATYQDVDYGVITNHITGIDEAIGNCKKLEQLYIANSHIAELPESLKELQSLTDLELYNNPMMKKFPMVLCELPELIQASLANNLQWTSEEVNAGIDALFSGKSAAKIQILYLNNNRITELPASCANLTKIGLLDLSSNKLSKLSAFGRKIRPVQLYLDNNDLHGQPFPEDFCGMEDFETFSCVNNHLTEFPNIFTSDTEYVILTVNFSENDIERIEGDNAYDDESPVAFRGIKCTTLNLGDNKFRGGIPAAFAKSKPISEITNFDLKDNWLDSLGWRGLKGMYSVASLDVSGNRITTTSKHPDFRPGIYCPYLAGIDMSRNAMTEFPEIMFNGYGINQFYFESQFDSQGERCFTEWPDRISNYMGIKILKMAGNDIRKIKTFPTQLNYLTIDDNPNIDVTIPDAICARIVAGTFYFGYDKTQQFITGCPQLGIGEEEE